MHCVPVVSLPVRSPGDSCGHRAAALPWAPLQPPFDVQGTQYQLILSAGGFVEKMRGGEAFCLPGGLLKTLR